MTAVQDLRRLLGGYRATQAVYVAATLRLSDLLAERPRTASELASATGTHEPSLARVLRALVGLGIYRVEPDGRFVTTHVGEALRSDAPGSLAGLARNIGRPYHWQAWGGLEHTVRTGESAFEAAYGMSLWEFRDQHPDEREIFDAAMTATSATVMDAVLDAFDFGAFTCLVDVGGGQGALLAAILSRHSALHGVLFDQPDVVSGAREVLAAAGVADRCQVVGGSFFDAVPGGADAYLLKSVIHDWSDEKSVEILRACRAAMAEGASLLLVERLLDQGPDPVDTVLSDLNMMVLPGGGERTQDGYAALLSDSGLRLRDVVPTHGVMFVLHAVAV